MHKFLLASFIGVFCVAVATAQEVPRFTFDAGAGFTTPVSDAGSNLDTGWNVQGGAGVNFTPYIGAKIQVDYNSLGINSATLANIGVPGGNVHIFSATVDPIIHLTPRSSKLGLYLVGGGGLYHWNQQFTAPSIATVTGFNPFFGFFPVSVPTTQILSSYSINKPGVNGGLGIEFGTRNRGKFFAEARWDRIFLGNSQYADYVPVSFGFRY